MHDEPLPSVATQPTTAQPAFYAGLDSFFTPGRLCFLLFLLMLCRFPEIILGSHTFFYRDAGLYGFPLAYYTKNSFWHGEIPLWNPYSTCGIPFLAQWNTLVLYPGSLVYLLFPMPWAMNAFELGHIFLAALGMYKLAHRLFGSRFGATIAGLAFAWNGLSLQSMMWPNTIAALAWMPWVVLLCERGWKRGDRAIVWAALAGACQMLTGAPELILFTWLIVAGWFVAASWQRKRWCWMDTLVLCGCAMLVAMLSAAQLLPTMDLIKHGDRSNGFDTTSWSMPLWGVANFFVPLFRCTPSVTGVWTQDQQQWTSSYYVGLATILLALVGVIRIRNLKTTLLALGAAFGIVLSMGDAAGILKFFKAILPMLDVIRYPIKYVALTIFALPLLAAAGAAYLQAQRRAKPVLIYGTIISAITLAILFITLSDSNIQRAAISQNGSIRLAALLVLIGLLIVAIKSLNRTTHIASLATVLLVFGIDICFHVPKQNPTVITAAYERRPMKDAKALKVGESRAMISAQVQELMENTAHPYPLNLYLGQRAELFGNCNLLDYGPTNAPDYTPIPKVNGFYPLHLREQSAVTKVLYAKSLPVPLAEFLGVSKMTSEEHLFTWDSVNGAMPMATIGQQPVFADESTTLELLRSFKPRDTVLLPADLKGKVSAVRDESARVIGQTVGTHEQRYQIEAKRPTMFVVAQTFYHNWKAFVDGKRVPLLRANEAFQAIEVSAGKHDVRLVYRDNLFYAGAMLSGIGLLACAAIIGFTRQSH